MLELAALGLLQDEPLHGYRLKKQLETFMGGCVSANYGAIYPLLKRLQRQGLIDVMLEEAGSQGGNRRIYCITPTGQDRWQQEMMAHPQESWVNSRARFMIKFLFFSHLQPEQRLSLMTHRLEACQQRLGKVQPDLTASQRDPYKALAWQRHQGNLQFEIQWLQAQINREQGILAGDSDAAPLSANSR
jgi:DNA-binding PadR family transcriptional regulator